MNLDDCRRFYSQEIRLAANLRSPALVAAYAHVTREHFLGPPPWQIASPEQRTMSLTGGTRMTYLDTSSPADLYHNVLVAVDPSRDIHNGQPSALGRWIDALDLKAGDRVYHLGCGVGYYTAILAEVVGPGGHVTGIDLEPDLAARARENLSAYPNVAVHAADGATFDPGDCDAMLINAGVTHPQPLWLDRLRDQGRLVVPITMAVNRTLGQGVMIRIVRENGGFSASTVTVMAIFSCTGARDPELEPLMMKALTSGGLLKVKSVRRDFHEPSDSCVVHGKEVCLSLRERGATAAG